MTGTGGVLEGCEPASLVYAVRKQQRDPVSNEVEGEDQECPLTSTYALLHARSHT